MSNLTNEQIKNELVKLGGKVWDEKGFDRVYISQSVFNQVTGLGYSLNESKNKFYYDVAEGGLFTRKDGKKPAMRATNQDITIQGPSGTDAMKDITVEFGFAWAHNGDETENLFQVCTNDDGLIDPSDCGWNEGLCGDYNTGGEEKFEQFIKLAGELGLLVE